MLRYHRTKFSVNLLCWNFGVSSITLFVILWLVFVCLVNRSLCMFTCPCVTMHLHVCLYINLYYVPCILNLCIVCYSWLASHSKANKKIGAWRTFVIRAITIYWDHIHVYMKLQYCSYCLTVVSQDGHLYEINVMRLIWRKTLLQTQ